VIGKVESVNEFGVSEMQHHRSVSCPAAAHAGNLGMIGAVMGMGIANAAVNSAIAVRASREATASATLAHQMRQAVESAHRWADIAKAQAAENEKLKAENERLKRIARDQHADLVAFSRSSK